MKFHYRVHKILIFVPNLSQFNLFVIVTRSSEIEGCSNKIRSHVRHILPPQGNTAKP
jgi:hypothetical protein